MRAHTTQYLYRDADYFTALTDSGAVRIGFVGGTCFDIPKYHAWFERVSEADCRLVVEDLHDQLMSAYA